jgi:hypothetical protein
LVEKINKEILLVLSYQYPKCVCPKIFWCPKMVSGLLYLYKLLGYCSFEKATDEFFPPKGSIHSETVSGCPAQPGYVPAAFIELVSTLAVPF